MNITLTAHTTPMMTSVVLLLTVDVELLDVEEPPAPPPLLAVKRRFFFVSVEVGEGLNSLKGGLGKRIFTTVVKPAARGKIFVVRIICGCVNFKEELTE